MPNYTKVGPFVDGGAPGIDHNFLNGVENQLAAVQYGTNFLASPYTLLNAVALTSGVTNNYTVTGGSTGVPTGAKGVLISCIFFSVSAFSFLQFAPHAGTLGNYASFGNTQVSGSNGTINGYAVVPCDASGIIDVKANVSNCTTTVIIYGYVY